MATTNFVNKSTIIEAEWLNAVDAVVYDILAGATTVAQAKAALAYTSADLGLGSSDSPTFTNLTLTGQITIQGGTPGAGQVLTSDGAGLATWEPVSADTTTIVINDNDSTAFEVKEATNNYIIVDTTNTAEQIILGNTTTNPNISIPGSGKLSVAVASTNSRLEVEDGNLSGSGPIVKITQDDQNLAGLIIGNDTFNTSDTIGLRLQVNNAGAAFVQATNGSAAPLCLGTDGGTSIFVIDSTGHIIIGENSLSTSAARLEIEDGNTVKSTLLKITQDDTTTTGLVLGNDTFSTNDTHGLRLHVDNSGSCTIEALGHTTNSEMIFKCTAGNILMIDGGSSGGVKIGDMAQAPSSNGRLEVTDKGFPGTASFPILKVTQDDANAIGIGIGNDTFSTNDLDGLRLAVSDAGLASVRAAGTNSELQFGVAADTDALTIDKTNGGLYTGGATGGSQGSGTINATGVYVNGVAVTDTTNIVRKYKTASESTSSDTTFSDDSTLAGWSLDAATWYKISGIIFVSGPSAADFKQQFTISQNFQVARYSYDIIHGVGATQQKTASDSPGTTFGAMSAIDITLTFLTAIYVEAVIQTHATLTSTLAYQWAQDVSNASNTTVNSGSFLEVTRLGT